MGSKTGKYRVKDRELQDKKLNVIKKWGTKKLNVT